MRRFGVAIGVGVATAVLLLAFPGDQGEPPSRVRTTASSSTTETSLIPPTYIEPTTTTLPPTTTTAPPPTTTSPPRTTTTHPSRSYVRPQPAPQPVEAAGGAVEECRRAAAARKGERVAERVVGWIDLVVAHFGGEVAKACGVMACESEGNPDAVGPVQRDGRTPNGLMQIVGGPFDPEANMRLAASMRSRRGWQPWACA